MKRLELTSPYEVRGRFWIYNPAGDMIKQDSFKVFVATKGHHDRAVEIAAEWMRAEWIGGYRDWVMNIDATAYVFGSPRRVRWLLLDSGK